MPEPNFFAPPALSPGDTIGIVSLASVLDEPRLRQGVAYLEQNFGLNVKIGQNALNTYHNFAGTDAERLADFQTMLDDKNIKAILAGRGGYGSSRIIELINWEKFLKNPKWIVGFSDITAVHLAVQSLGIQSIHGPMAVTVFAHEASAQSLYQALFGQPLHYQLHPHPFNTSGQAQGPIIGGNLCLLNHCLATPTDVPFDGKILFIEDVGEYLYNLDRMMVQLKRSGKLTNLAGLLVGQFSDLKENSTAFGKTAYEIIKEHSDAYHYPKAFDVPIGHVDHNLAIRCGEIMQLSVADEGGFLQSINHKIA